MIELSKLGPFALENRLGNDPDSHVFHGFHLKQKRQAVVCILPERYAENPRARQRLEKRSRQLMKLNHPNIVRYHGAGIDQGIPFFALDFVDGISLQQYLEQHGPLPWETVVEIGLQVCAALAASHHMNIHHLDVRPAHILLSGAGLTDPRKPLTVQLTSFWADPRWRRSSLLLFPKDRQQYLSPEQFEDPQYVDDATDIFSLGCVFYEMITGKLPFNPLASGDERWKLPERPASLELDCPVWLDRVIMRMIEIMPDRRPPDIDSVAAGLRESQDAVARGMSAIEHALVGNNGRESIIDIGIDRSEAEKLLHKPVSHERGSFFNSRIFLGLALIVVIGALVWLLRPLNDAQLYARAEPLMLTDDTTKWREAETNYIQPLLERYPDSEYADEAQNWLDMIQMERAEARLAISLRMGREFRSDAERRLANARGLEENGNHLGAWHQYDMILEELPETVDNRPYHLIAKREINRLQHLRVTGKVQNSSLNDFVLQAEEMTVSGDVKRGREIFRRIVSLYQESPDGAGAVELAKSELAKPISMSATKEGNSAKTKVAQETDTPQEVRKPDLNSAEAPADAGPVMPTPVTDPASDAAPSTSEIDLSETASPEAGPIEEKPVKRAPLFPVNPGFSGDSSEL
ncbi:Serine/threonine-protein kinase StkP [Bremerella volcania]|uniref:Serine/threonine-protein kinase StkP n=1 Tax=Bremerella volcania TaxID=2527984 RepID=A0A518CFU3_9BACT|nr:protein kinase [Bremerella volcania]QDU78081.1 Serine/threonine-protein kinase StkP [Bremerella volcania]